MENTRAVPNLTKEAEVDRSSPVVESLERFIDALEHRKPVGLLIAEAKDILKTYKSKENEK